jgi:ABC-type transporter Mla MlaB component
VHTSEGVVTWALGAGVGRADVPELCARLAALLRESRAAVVVYDVAAITEPDAGTVDLLARLQLTARRLGRGILVHRAHPRLRELLALTGLTEVLPPPGDGGGSVLVEPGREAEQREQVLGVEERVEPRDPAA